MARRRVRLLAVALTWLAVELLALAAARLLAGSGLFYAPPRLERDELDLYLEQRDPVLGWPPRSGFGRRGRGGDGARRDPAFDDSLEPCVALYGDSQTWGAEVGDGEAWGSLLARRLGCRVANFGAGGYGSDQALLRYLERDDGGADHVVIGHWSENVLRNVNQYRRLLYGGAFGLKPRFVLGAGGELRLVPMPTPDAEGFRRLVEEPGAFLTHEFFLTGTRWGPAPVRFPWSLAALRAAGHFRVRARLAGRPAYAAFYEPDHPSGALDLTVAILARFRDEARRRGQHPTVLLIPTGGDLSAVAGGGEWPYRPLVDRLEQAGVGRLDAGPPILERVGTRDPCELFEDCSAHFDAEGNALLAEFVAEHLCREDARRPRLPGCRPAAVP